MVGSAGREGSAAVVPVPPSGSKFNQSKGPRLYASVSPTLDEQGAGDGTPLAEGDATYDGHTPAYNDAMNMSSQISIDMTKYWTRESASTVKRWDTEVGRNPRRQPGQVQPTSDRLAKGGRWESCQLQERG